jgi:hypothetical protein
LRGEAGHARAFLSHGWEIREWYTERPAMGGTGAHGRYRRSVTDRRDPWEIPGDSGRSDMEDRGRFREDCEIRDERSIEDIGKSGGSTERWERVLFCTFILILNCSNSTINMVHIAITNLLGLEICLILIDR